MTPTLCNRSHLDCCAPDRLLTSKVCGAATYVLVLLCWPLVAASCYVSLLLLCIVFFMLYCNIFPYFFVVARLGSADCKGSQLHGVWASFSSSRVLFFLLLIIFKMRHCTPLRLSRIYYVLFCLSRSCISFLTKINTKLEHTC